MKIKIRGKKKLEGNIVIKGAKNSAVAIIPAAILSDDEVILHNIPKIKDVEILLNILRDFGYSIDFRNNSLRIKKLKKHSYVIDNEEVGKMRGSYYFLGSFLGKYHKITMNSSGGCNLGLRPINYHLDGFSKLGVKYYVKNNHLHLKAKRLIGNTINLQFPSVGATINIMLASCKAKGRTIINNAAKEPEVIDTANFLNSMGAIVCGAGSNTITIDGVKKLHKTEYTIMSDRIEAGTYLILGALSRGKGITIDKVNTEHLKIVIDTLKKMGAKMIVSPTRIYIKVNTDLNPTDVITGPYPLFPTDLGPMITVLFTQANGTSTLKETIFTNRFSQIEELIKMGADIVINSDTVTINGPTKLKRADLIARDLRGAASLVLASSLSRGFSIIDNIDVIYRGYEDIFNTLTSLGMEIKDLKNENTR